MASERSNQNYGIFFTYFIDIGEALSVRAGVLVGVEEHVVVGVSLILERHVLLAANKRRKVVIHAVRIANVPFVAHVINFLVLFICIKQAQNCNYRKRPENESNNPVNPAQSHMPWQIVLFHAI